ncbi:MAG: flagellar basal-body rod protein FlgG [Halobacteriovoraceae bacterium]|nr:flagellar basal-body rod protein FlgG [Halobacteriovoraceae bacterium]|tara:strand:+ start:6435 stop:7217 length:783 start_codon:yes stop_codon:yes gene_type:complete
MIRALNTAATGMASQEQQVNTISNNIANANTTGYKSQRTEFEDLLYETVEEAGGRSSGDSQYTVGHQVGSGSRVTATRRMLDMGSPQITNRPYDLMIMGDGYFGVQAKNEILYTRDGSFTVDAQGILKTKAGHSLLPNITVPPNTKHLSISEDGKVQAFLTNGTAPIELGQIPVFTFVNPAGLSDMGGNMARVTTASGSPIEHIPGNDNSGIIQQGALESSNVNVMNEMTNLIKAQRAYEMNSKVMGVADQMLSTVNRIK